MKKFKKFIKRIQVLKILFLLVLVPDIFLKKILLKNFFQNNLVNFHGTRLPLDAGGGGFFLENNEKIE